MARSHELPSDAAAASRGIIGFHGAGGGSTGCLEAVSNEGFTLADISDTSGRASVADVYRAARIILSTPGLAGYFGCCSSAAPRDQYHAAYGLAKAFLELNLSIPAVVRLGGTGEDGAVEILHDACRDLPAVVEGYTQDDTPADCASRFAALVEASGGGSAPMIRRTPGFVGRDDAFRCPVRGGRLWIDHAACNPETAAAVVERGHGLLGLDANGHPVPAGDVEAVADKVSELIACEIECLRGGTPVVFVDLWLEERGT